MTSTPVLYNLYVIWPFQVVLVQNKKYGKHCTTWWFRSRNILDDSCMLRGTAYQHRTRGYPVVQICKMFGHVKCKELHLERLL